MTSPKRAYITGVTGENSSYLTELPLKEECQIHEVKRRSSSLSTQRFDNFYLGPNEP